MNIKLNLFYFFWSIGKRFFTVVSGDVNSITNWGLFQINLAKIFGSTKAFVIGDSNAAVLSSKKEMLQLAKGIDGIILNLGVPGTRPEDWVMYFETQGQELYGELFASKAVAFWNIGGNSVLQNKLEDGLKYLPYVKRLFKKSFNNLIPPIHISMLKGGYDKDYLKEGVEKINAKIYEEWKRYSIDTYSPLLDHRTMEAYLVLNDVLADPIHFSDNADIKFRIPLMIAAYKTSDIQ